MPDILLHIGPLTRPKGGNGDTLFFLDPPRADGVGPVLASSLADALAQLGVDAANVVGEPALKAKIGDVKLECLEALPPSAKFALAMMAIEIAGVTDFKEMANEALVTEAFEAMAAFYQRLTVGWPEDRTQFATSTEGVAVVLTASRCLTVAASVVAAMVGGVEATFDDHRLLPDWWPSSDDDAEDDHPSACGPPVECLDALVRTYGIAALPRAQRRSGFERAPLTEEQLATLTATLRAVCAMSPDARTATGSVDVAGASVEVSVSVQMANDEEELPMLLHVGPITEAAAEGQTLYFVRAPDGRETPPLVARTPADALRAFNATPSQVIGEPSLRSSLDGLELACADELPDGARVALLRMVLRLCPDFGSVERRDIACEYSRALTAFVEMVDTGWPDGCLGEVPIVYSLAATVAASAAIPPTAAKPSRSSSRGRTSSGAHRCLPPSSSAWSRA